MENHTGGCHCGKVKYEVKGDFHNVMDCNCSHCEKKGFFLAFVPESDFKLLSGEENLTDYRFNKGKISHLFCKDCGVQSFGRGQNSKGEKTIMINVRCIDNVDLNNLNIKKVDGKSW